jgi:pyruvate dehydrogenase E2 component (dihydrolipoamide acetyltransferase)
VTTAIKLPELGENVDSGELTKVLVSVGDTVSKDQALLELETEKATIEVPSPVSGVIKELHVQEGRKVSVGDLLFTVEEAGNGAEPKQKPQQGTKPAQPPRFEAVKTAAPQFDQEKEQKRHTVAPAVQEGRPKRVPAPECSRPEADKLSGPEKPGPRPPSISQAQPEQPRVQQGGAQSAPADVPAEAEHQETVIPFRAESAEPSKRPVLAPASPAIRRFARELGVDINKVTGTGPEGRIDEEDVKNYAREIIARVGVTRSIPGGSAPIPDFSKWGEIERKPMTSVRRSTAQHLSQAWQNVPQVTQFDNADITELEATRSRFAAQQSDGPRITLTAIALKMVAAGLRKFPQFAASIDVASQEIIYKRYCNIGIAVDTSYGLVVPVIRDVDRKSIIQLATELAGISAKARDKKLSLDEMSGGVFTITNLGGIGGTAFSPIVNFPEVAILGISRVATAPHYVEGVVQPRKILPLSLSYDHRVIDGVDGARFLRWVAEALEEPLLLLFRD